MKRILKFIFAVVFLVTIATVSILFDTKSKVTIANTYSGTGTQEDPYIVSTFADLATVVGINNAHIVVENFEEGNLDDCGYYTPTLEDLEQDSKWCFGFYTGYTIHITINCDIKIKQTPNHPELCYVFYGGGEDEYNGKANLFFDGTGTISFKPYKCDTNQYGIGTLSIIRNTNCTIDGNLTFTSDLTNTDHYRCTGLYATYPSNLTINGGTFIAQCSGDYIGGYGVYCSMLETSNVTINGGHFLVDESSESYVPSEGLNIYAKNAGLQDNLHIYGGEFDGISCRYAGFDINDCLADDHQFVLDDDTVVEDGVTETAAHLIAQPNPTYAFNVSFDANGGEGSMGSVIADSKNYTLPSCEFTNNASLAFRGWMLSEDSDEIHPEGDEIIINDDITLYAAWSEKETYAITYADAQGNTFTYYLLEGSEFSVWSFESCGFKAPVGQRFTVWESRWADPRIDVEPNSYYTVPDDDVYFMAKYESTGQKVCTIDFNNSGGEGEMESISILAGTFYTLPANTKFSNGSAPFRYWDVGVYGYMSPYDTVFVRENMSISAVWGEPIGIEVTHNSGYTLYGGPARYDNLSAYLIYNDGSKEELNPENDLEITVLNDEQDYEPVNLYIFQPGEAKECHFKARYIKELGLEDEFDIHYGDYRKMFFVSNEAFGESFTLYWLNNETYNLPEYPYETSVEFAFLCWQKPDGEQLLANAEYTVTNSETFYANIGSAPYMLSYDSGLGTGAMDANECYYNQNFYLPKPSFTAPEGYVFDYWLVEDVILQANILYDYQWAKDVVAVAQYRVKETPTFVVSYDNNGGSRTINSSTVTEGHVYTIASDTALNPPAGHTFDYWEVTIGENDPLNKQPGETVTITDNTLIKAIWKEQTPKYTISFNANGGTGDMPNEIVEAGEYTLPVCGFTEPIGYSFRGWSLTSDGSVCGSTINVTADIELFALWDVDIMPPTICIISFNANGGSGKMKDVEINTDESTKYILPTCTFKAPDGKQFEAWEINSIKHNVGEEITIGVDTEIKALWKDITTEPDNPDPEQPGNPETPEKGVDNKKLSAGAIVAIVIASVVVLGIGGFAIVWFVVKKKTWADLKKK